MCWCATLLAWCWFVSICGVFRFRVARLVLLVGCRVAVGLALFVMIWFRCWNGWCCWVSMIALMVFGFGCSIFWFGWRMVWTSFLLVLFDDFVGWVVALLVMEMHFVMVCMFWLVDNYVLVGCWVEVRVIFEWLLLFCNDVGLLVEQYDVVVG